MFDAVPAVRPRGGNERTLSIVGIDELRPVNGRVSWISPIATASMKEVAGDVATRKTPGGEEQLEVVDIRYDPLP